MSKVERNVSSGTENVRVRPRLLSTSFFFSIIPLPPRSTLFPYTTLFRSDEVLELLLVLVGVPVGLVAENSPLLNEVLERGAGVARRPEPELARRFGRGQRAAPPQEVEEIGRAHV